MHTMAANSDFSDFENQLQSHVEVLDLKLGELKSRFIDAMSRGDISQCKILETERSLLDVNKKRLLAMLISVKQQHHDFLMSQLTSDFVKITQKSGKALGKSTPSERQAVAALRQFESSVSATHALNEKIGDFAVESAETGAETVESGLMASSVGMEEDMMTAWASNFGIKNEPLAKAGATPVGVAPSAKPPGDGGALETVLGLPPVPTATPLGAKSTTGLDLLRS